MAIREVERVIFSSSFSSDESIDLDDSVDSVGLPCWFSAVAAAAARAAAVPGNGSLTFPCRSVR